MLPRVPARQPAQRVRRNGLTQLQLSHVECEVRALPRVSTKLFNAKVVARNGYIVTALELQRPSLRSSLAVQSSLRVFIAQIPATKKSLRV